MQSIKTKWHVQANDMSFCCDTYNSICNHMTTKQSEKASSNRHKWGLPSIILLLRHTVLHLVIITFFFDALSGHYSDLLINLRVLLWWLHEGSQEGRSEMFTTVSQQQLGFLPASPFSCMCLPWSRSTFYSMRICWRCSYLLGSTLDWTATTVYH